MKLEPKVQFRARAPLRISLGGGGTELASYAERYGGVVLNATIAHRVYATATACDKVVFASLENQAAEEFAAGEVRTPQDSSLRLHEAVYTHVMDNYCAGESVPLRLATFSDVVGGSGLGSSSALTAAILKCLDEALGLGLDKHALAALAHRIERVELGMSGGSQDHYAAAFGGVNFMEFKQDGVVEVEPQRISAGAKAELEHSLVLHFTGVSRYSGRIIDTQTDRIASDNEQTLASLHRIKALALQMKDALAGSRFRELAELLHESWEAKKATSPDITNEQIDSLYARARESGAWGGKISGAGGGGYMILLCDPNRRGQLLASLPAGSGQNSYCTFDDHGALSWQVKG